MASFKFGSTKKIYTIEGISKEYVIDVGNVETMKAWREQLPSVLANAEAMGKGGADLEPLILLIKDMVNLILDNDFPVIWDLSGHNIYAMLGLISDLSKIIGDAQKDIAKTYGL